MFRNLEPRSNTVPLALAAAALAAALQAGAGRAATFTVTNTNDAGVGSLRRAINDANGTAGTDTITFSIGSGAKSIALASPLPTITQPVVVDARTQPGFAGSPLIELNGASAGAGANGFTVNHSGVTQISGFVINRFSSNGIHVTSAAALITGNWIGTNAAGNAASANGNDGVFLSNTVSATVGGTTAADRNVISGNAVDGLRIDGAGATGNVVAGNYIGTDASGSAAVQNGFNGITIMNAPSNTIGGVGAATRNVISGNGKQGIGIRGATASGNLVASNVIGTNAAVTAALPNWENGVYIIDAPGNFVGGSVGGTFNVISGNYNGNGVLITGSGSTGNLVQRNVIGTNVPGTAAIGNVTGVSIVNASNNRIGTEWGSGGNLVSGNNYGIAISGATASGNIVSGNRIGTTLNGTGDLGNVIVGIAVDAPGNRIGGTLNVTPGGACTGECNLISGNGNSWDYAGGVSLSGANAAGNVVLGNFIGTDVNGVVAISNDKSGIYAAAAGNTIGGTAPNAGNLISGNTSYGLWLTGTGSAPTVVEGNFIGTSRTGTSALPNGLGVRVLAGPATIGGTTGVTPGGSCTGACNVISGNTGFGIDLSAIAAATVLGNYVGTNAAGTMAIPNAVGVRAWSSSVGDGSAAGRNVISGNTGNGIEVGFTTVRGNYVGYSSTGGALGNGGHGIWCGTAVDTTAIERNAIGWNSGAGVRLGPSYDVFRLKENVIFGNAGLGIDLEPAGPNANDTGDGDNGVNTLQNYPVITGATLCGGALVVTGTLNSMAGYPFVIELFSSPSCTGSGYGQAQTFLTALNVSTNGSGNATFQATSPVAVPAGHIVTATASLQGDMTSEFASCVTVAADAIDPVVTPPAAVTLSQTLCCGTFGGATSGTSGALAAFLAGGSATDNCGSVTALAPRVAGVDVTPATCFAAGTTTVRFRFADAEGNVGGANSSVTVRMFGDLNLDAMVDPSDFVILRDYLNFVVSPGVPPFSAPVGMADVNHDGMVDPGDFVVLRDYLNFVRSCLAS